MNALNVEQIRASVSLGIPNVDKPKFLTGTMHKNNFGSSAHHSFLSTFIEATQFSVLLMIIEIHAYNVPTKCFLPSTTS